ncbi:MAG: DNA adenine methylase [Muribaculaceae bacterium]|nr:DNA adenine methylase [Muribaculaceae bacterium]
MFSHKQLQLSLFEDNSFMDIKFPKPQYLGAKYIHKDWITQYIPDNANVVLDGFSGSQSIAFRCKQMGKSVITNDFLRFNYEIGKALVENNSETLTKHDINILFSENSNPDKYNLMETLFTDLFFVRDETRFLDAFRSNIHLLENEYKQSLAFAVINRAMTRKVTMGHFAHTQALVYAADPQRIKRNRSLIRSIKEIFTDLVVEYNDAVFDNGEKCKSYNNDILDLLPILEGVDLVYFDPPYCDSHADYQGFYHLLETFTNYWKDKEFVNGTKRYSPKLHSGFETKKEIIQSFQKLFSSSIHIPHWIISYNDRSFPDINTLIDLIKPYRDVKVERKIYQNGRGGKGSVAGSSEIILICNPK